MKIEKVNDNQIRCTLTREDLVSREIKISELAYGTEKAKNLFREMMRQANFEFGFEAEDIPLMIEAIPLNAECIVLVITKVEDPDELDTRFSRFAPSVMEHDEDSDSEEDMSSETEDPEEVRDLFHRIHAATSDRLAQSPNQSVSRKATADTTRIYLLDSISQVISLCRMINSHFSGNSTLYKDDASGSYLLKLVRGDETAEDFDRTCNIASEYGVLQRHLNESGAFLAEHCKALLADHAVASLGNM